MKCPYCSYEHGWSVDKNESIEGVRGEFYVLPIKLEREYNYREERISLYACPICNKTFILGY